MSFNRKMGTEKLRTPKKQAITNQTHLDRELELAVEKSACPRGQLRDLGSLLSLAHFAERLSQKYL